MPAMSSAVLMVMLMGRDYPIRGHSPRVSPGKMHALTDSPSQRPRQFRITYFCIPIQGHPVTLHISFFEGGNALSDFRIQQLLPRLAQISPNIQGLAARFVHLVATETTLQGDQEKTLAALLAYGDPYTGPASGPTDGPVIVVSPRLGTVSPWASKATDIAHNCGLQLKRVERITEYRLVLNTGLLGGAKALSDEQLGQVAALLNDRMTESALPSRGEAQELFTG